MIESQFYIRVLASGEQFPEMSIQNIEYANLSHICFGGMASSSVTKNEIDKAYLVMHGSLDRHFLAYSEFIYLDIFKDITMVSNGIGDEFFKPFNVPTFELYDLLMRWYKFLCVYENNEIPGLVYAGKLKS